MLDVSLTMSARPAASHVTKITSSARECLSIRACDRESNLDERKTYLNSSSNYLVEMWPACKHFAPLVSYGSSLCYFILEGCSKAMYWRMCVHCSQPATGARPAGRLDLPFAMVHPRDRTPSELQCGVQIDEQVELSDQIEHYLIPTHQPIAYPEVR